MSVQIRISFPADKSPAGLPAFESPAGGLVPAAGAWPEFGAVPCVSSSISRSTSSCRAIEVRLLLTKVRSDLLSFR
jgi:hypothetical protein